MRKFLTLVLFSIIFLDINAREIEVSINSRTGVKLGGILSIPDVYNKNIMVILISHMIDGPRAREDLYKVMADSLLSNGIASFRYHNRIVSDSIENRFTYLNTSYIDSSEDCIDIFNQLQDMPQLTGYRIGFCGISECGMVACAAATKTDCDFCVSMATPTMDGFWQHCYSSFSQYIKLMLGNSRADAINMNFKLLELGACRTSPSEVKTFIKSLYDQKKIPEKEYIKTDSIIDDVIKNKSVKHEQDMDRYSLSQYADSIKCPVLYVAFKYDERLNALHELAWFEKIMFQHGKRDIRTAVVDCSHQMMTKEDFFFYDRDMHYGQNLEKKPNRAKLPDVISTLVGYLNDLYARK